MGLSFGVPGARYTINTKGRRTISTGIPGTGIYNVETLSSGRTSSRTRKAAEEPEYTAYGAPIKPGLFSPKYEKEFNKFLLDIYGSADGQKDNQRSVLDKGNALKVKFPELTKPVDAVMFLHAITSAETSSDGEKLGMAIWASRQEYFDNSIAKKYFAGMKVAFELTRGVTSTDEYSEQTFGLMWAEALQAGERYQESMDVLQDLTADQLVGLALADLEITMKDYDGAIETTEDIENEDDTTAMMLIFRGIAFREKDLNEAALECFKRALASKKRSLEVLHRGLYERSFAYLNMGKKAMARKDLEKILVDEPTAAHVLAALAKLD
jgi:tetratricopeptide (TPR) repeat protein